MGIERHFKRIEILLLTLAFLVLPGCKSTDENKTIKSEKAKSDSKSPPSDLLEYVEVLTEGAKWEDPLPLIVAVHGLGDRPRNFLTLIRELPVPARIVVPQAPIKWGPGYAWFTTRVASGDFEKLSNGIARSAKQNADLLEYILSKRTVRGRPIFLGFSQGGMISFAMASNHPENLGLVIPIGGLLPKPLRLKEKDQSVNYPKIHALHGVRDPLVSIDAARDAVKHMKSKGLDVELTEYPDAFHNINLSMRKKLFHIIQDAIKKM